MSSKVNTQVDPLRGRDGWIWAREAQERDKQMNMSKSTQAARWLYSVGKGGTLKLCANQDGDMSRYFMRDCGGVIYYDDSEGGAAFVVAAGGLEGCAV